MDMWTGCIYSWDVPHKHIYGLVLDSERYVACTCYGNIGSGTLVRAIGKSILAEERLTLTIVPR